MEEKKKLKKLSLSKEQIVNLNDGDMRQIQGGTSITVTLTPLTVTLIPDPEPKDDAISAEVIIDSEGNGACLLPEVPVYG